MVAKKEVKTDAKKATETKPEDEKVKAGARTKAVEAEPVGVDDLVDTTDIISWEAQEYVVRDKTSWWYVGLAVVTLLLAGLAVWLQWWTFLIVVILSVVALLIYTLRPPRILRYSLTNKGVSEGDQLHEYSEFKSFGILQEEGHFAIILTPHKRFYPRVTVYFPEAQGEEIVDAFGARLPMEDVQLDMLDKLIKFLRI